MPAAEFVSLADMLMRVESPPASIDSSEVRDATGEPRDCTAACAAAPSPPDVPIDAGDDVGGALRDARLFRARLADAFDDALGRLLCELAADVLARELRLAPCDLAALVARVAQRAPFVRLRVALTEAARDYGVPVVADATLEPGDAILELAGGALDVRLGVRLAGVLERFA